MTGQHGFFTAVALACCVFCATAQTTSEGPPVAVLSNERSIAGPMPQCQAPKIEFEILAKPAEISNVASVKTMTTYSNSQHPTVGLYRARQRVYLRAQRVTSMETKEICLPSLAISYAINHAIDVGREYQPGSCAYEETVRHERMHERIHLQKAQEAQQHIARELAREPLYFSGPNFQQDATAWMSRTVQWATQVYTGYVEPAQAAFDSPQEYDRFSKACAHELRYHGYQGAFR